MTFHDTIQPGSIVQIGKGGDPLYRMTWRVLRIDQAAEGVLYARIQSGGSGQIRTEPVNNLTPFRVAESENS